jgi:hypothetical protein
LIMFDGCKPRNIRRPGVHASGNALTKRQDSIWSAFAGDAHSGIPWDLSESL